MKLSIECVLSHSTMRGEKAGGVVEQMASDIKLSGPVLIDKVRDLFLSDEEFEALMSGMFKPDTDEPICPQLQPLVLEREFADCQAKVNSAVGTAASAQAFPKARLKNFQFKPILGRAVEFSATLQVYPTDPQWAVIAHWREKTVKVEVEGGGIVEEKSEKQQSLAIGKEPPKEKPEQKRKGRNKDSAGEPAPVH